MKKGVFILWGEEDRSSQFLAESFGFELIISYKLEYKGYKLPLMFQYIFQAVDTFKKLSYLKPEIILVQNPPIFNTLIVYFYCRMNKGVIYVIDSKNEAFLGRRLRIFNLLFIFLAKRSALNLVNNYKYCGYFRKWGIFHNYILQFNIPKISGILKKESKLPGFINKKFKEQLGFKIMAINFFSSEDPCLEVIETARLLPRITFFITGDNSRISTQVRQSSPKNVLFSGRLTYYQHIELMNNCDLILALSKRKDAVIRSLMEILALNKPFVTSDSEVMRHYFKKVAIFSKIRPQEIRKKINETLAKRFEIKGEITKFIEKDKDRWKKDIQVIKGILEEKSANNTSYRASISNTKTTSARYIYR